MTEDRVETLLRATFREREQLVGETELVGPVRVRIARQRRRHTVLAGVAVLALLGGIVGAAALHGPRGAARPPSAHPAPVRSTWTAYSTRGAQIRVPADWVLNDYGCGMDARPTIVRAPGPQRLCLTLEPATKEVALLNNHVELPNTLVRDPWNGPDVPPGVSAHRASVRIGGVVGERAEFRLPDGRYAGWVKLPAQELALSVRTRDAATRQRILDSLELVDVDANGCPTRGQQRRPGPAARPVTSVSVCYYGGSISPLTASTRLTGAAAAELLHALDVARPGRNPDCGTRNGVDVSQVALQLRDAAGAVQDTVGVRFQGCINRGIDRGDKQGIVTRSLVDLIMNPLHTGYEFRPDLPK